MTTERKEMGRSARAMTGRLAIAGLGALLLTGCLSAPSKYQDDPQYQAGYSAGCSAGTVYEPGFPDTLERDEVRFKSNESYRAGWNSGFSACARQLPGERDGDFLVDSRAQSGPFSRKF